MWCGVWVAQGHYEVTLRRAAGQPMPRTPRGEATETIPSASRTGRAVPRLLASPSAERDTALRDTGICAVVHVIRGTVGGGILRSTLLQAAAELSLDRRVSVWQVVPISGRSEEPLPPRCSAPVRRMRVAQFVARLLLTRARRTRKTVFHLHSGPAMLSSKVPET